MIEIDNVTIGYKSKVVAKGLSASLHEGELTCLIGRNGAGKSTLLRTMAAFQRPLGGIVRYRGTDIASLSAVERAKTIGIVLTEKPDVQNMTAREMVAMGRTPYTGFFGRLTTEDKEIVQRAMMMTGTEALAERMVQTLSDGERQKIMIAKTLAQQTPFILLDEPTAFLDYPSKIETMLMLKRLCQEERKAVIISTHDLDVALKHCSRVWHLHQGQLDTDIKGATPDMFVSINSES